MTATTPLSCDGFANALADYLERDDTPRVRAAVETHAAGCAQCGALLADLQQLRIDAAGLPTLTPSRDLWAGIAERIETPVLEIGARAGAPWAGGRGPRGYAAQRFAGWVRPALAAAALVVMTAGVTYVVTRETLLPETQTAVEDSAALDPAKAVADAFDSAQRAQDVVTRATAARPAAAEPVRTSRVQPPAPGGQPGEARGLGSLASNTQLPVAATLQETVYDREIERLRRLVDQRRAQLDTATVGVIERNLMVIDQAIRESRAALARDPASAFLNEQLTNVLEQKVELLRAAVLLPVRT